MVAYFAHRSRCITVVCVAHLSFKCSGQLSSRSSCRTAQVLMTWKGHYQPQLMKHSVRTSLTIENWLLKKIKGKPSFFSKHCMPTLLSTSMWRHKFHSTSNSGDCGAVKNDWNFIILFGLACRSYLLIQLNQFFSWMSLYSTNKDLSILLLSRLHSPRQSKINQACSDTSWNKGCGTAAMTYF